MFAAHPVSVPAGLCTFFFTTFNMLQHVLFFFFAPWRHTRFGVVIAINRSVEPCAGGAATAGFRVAAGELSLQNKWCKRCCLLINAS